MAYLELYKTDFRELDGEGPDRILLEQEGERPPLMLGRGSQLLPADVKIFARYNEAEIISRQHAKIECMELNCGDSQRPPIYTVECMKALNGTFVNRTRIGKVCLRDGDILQLGGLTLKTQVGDMLPDDNNKNCVKYIFRQPVMVPPNSNRRGTKRQPSATTNENNDNNSSKRSTTTTSSSGSKQQRLPSSSSSSGAISAASNGSGNHHVSEDELTSRRDFNTWLFRHGGISGALADKYSALLWENGVGSVARLERKLSRVQDNYLVSIGFEDDDVDDILRAFSAASGAQVLLPVVSAPAPAPVSVPVPVQASEVLAVASESQSRPSSKHRSTSSSRQPHTDKRSNSDECSIHISALRSALVCPICSLSLLDAVVAPCSHGFCMSCLEQHLSTHTTPCPICTGEQSQNEDNKKNRNGSGSSSSGTSANNSRNVSALRYVRSVHLDEVVGLLMAASSTMEQKQFAEREKNARTVLLGLGVSMHHHQHTVESGNQEGGPNSNAGSSQVVGQSDDDEDVEENDGEVKDSSSNDSYDNGESNNSRQSYDN